MEPIKISLSVSNMRLLSFNHNTCTLSESECTVSERSNMLFLIKIPIPPDFLMYF